MAEITAKLVNELRARTGQGMMECKKALMETGGDLEKAEDWFRKKGIKTSVLSRQATEGRVAVAVSADGRVGAIVEVLCNTDFTARSEPIGRIAAAATALLLADPVAQVAANPDVQALVVSAAQQTGENVQIGRCAVLSAGSGRVGGYQHYTGRVGVLVAATGNPGDELLRDLCLHIAAARPLAVNRESLPPELVAREREIAVEQAKASGKPQNIAEKIAEGKLRTFYEEKVLLEQKFVKDDKKTVGQLLQSAGAGVEKFVRFEIGQ